MTIVNIVFVASKLRSNDNSHSLDNFAELVEKFQLALHRHYNTGGHSLYQSDELKSFCQTHCPRLYDILLSSITRVDGRSTQKNHTELQQQRVVVLLHTLAYFRYSILILIVQHEQV